MKPYLVELKIVAVVMAESTIDAIGVAESEADEIFRDGELCAEDATEILSLEQLKRLDSAGWDGMCIPYNGDGDTCLKDLLPEADPFKDTKTKDLFA